MDILLIQPKMKKRPMDTSLKSKMSPSLALLTIKNLIPRKHSVKIINENIEEIDYSEKADLVAVTVTVDVLPAAIEIAKKFKERDNKIITVGGGIHITACPDSAEDKFDAISIGKAEGSWPELLRDIERGNLKKVYKDNLNSTIKSPAYEQEKGSKYMFTNIISTSRGCPNRCSFCYNSCKHSTPYTNRKIEDVIYDIKTIDRRRVLFIDDNFIGNINWTTEFLMRIKKMNLRWSAAVTANIINYPSLLDLMEETGCESLFIGFESLNKKSLNEVNKDTNDIRRYEELIDELHKRNIMVNASIVFGLPHDDKDVFKRTAKWLIAKKVETTTAHILTPYPGTKLYKDMLKAGKITEFDLSKYNTAHVVFSPDKMTKDELYNGYLNFYKEFYSMKNIIKRIPESKRQVLPYLSFNILYRKFGKVTEFLANFIPLGAIEKFLTEISYKKGR